MAADSYILPEDQPEPVNEDQRPCATIRSDLKECMLATDCCRVEGKTPRQCLKEKHESVPERCYRLVYLFYECKRSVLDNRVRFRGRKGYTSS